MATVLDACNSHSFKTMRSFRISGIWRYAASSHDGRDVESVSHSLKTPVRDNHDHFQKWAAHH